MTSPDRIAKGLWWDRAWSCIEGCTPVSEACRNCWSATQTHMRAKQSNPKIVARYGGLTNESGRFNGTVRPMHAALEIPLRVRKPKTWAVWNDLFHKDVPDNFIARAFAAMAQAYWHTFIALTKRIDRAEKLLPGLHLPMTRQFRNFVDYEKPVGPWPLPNVIVGTTVEDQKAADERVPFLLQTPAARRVISYEPALEAVDFGPALNGYPEQTGPDDWTQTHPPPDWIIAGCESGRNARETSDDWLRQVRDQCQAAGVPFFLKQQVGQDCKLHKMPELDGKVWDQMPELSR